MLIGIQTLTTMNKLLPIIIFAFLSFITQAQIKTKSPFITGSINTTFGINEQYNLSDEGNGPFIVPASILLRTEFGYQFDERWATSINFGYDHHFRYAINAIPYYGSLKYNFIVKSSSAYFIETSFGQMWRPSSKFSNGNYYKIGLGLLSLSSSRWNGMLRIDFHRKKIADFKDGNLDSVSLGIGFSFF